MSENPFFARLARAFGKPGPQAKPMTMPKQRPAKRATATKPKPAARKAPPPRTNAAPPADDFRHLASGSGAPILDGQDGFADRMADAAARSAQRSSPKPTGFAAKVAAARRKAGLDG